MGIISSHISNIQIELHGKKIKAKRIGVTSELNIDIDSAWNELQKSSLLRFVSDGKNSFSQLPQTWKVDELIETNIRSFAGSLLPIPGLEHSFPMSTPHKITFTDINEQEYSASTHEENASVTVWDHNMKMEISDDGLSTVYTDEIVIFAGLLTGLLAKNTLELYRHRHKKWQEVVEILKSGSSTSDEKYIIQPLSHK